MDKLTVSQCITADWCRGYNAAVEKANKEINKMKKHNERLKRVLKSKIKVYVYKEDHTGCIGCVHVQKYGYEMPCKKCKGIVCRTDAEHKTRKDYWRACDD